MQNQRIWGKEHLVAYFVCKYIVGENKFIANNLSTQMNRYFDCSTSDPTLFQNENESEQIHLYANVI